MYTKTVHEFTRVCESHLPQSPTFMAQENIHFIRKMVNDELDELENSKTIAEQADALVDAVYYICDTAVRHGMNLDPLFEIVHAANMKKIVDGKILRREDGKILKPQGWEEPTQKLANEIERQTRTGSFS